VRVNIMDAKEKEILNEIISGTKCQFVIPVFQRNYDWEEKDCKRLFNDIIELAENKEDKNKKHFIGAFVYKFNKLVETSFNEYILIDGQQRLTSLTLLLKALYDFTKVETDIYEDLPDQIYETYLINKFAKSENFRLKLKPNKVDNRYFNMLMNDDIESIDKTSNIYRNYHFFLDEISKMNVSVEVFYNAMQRIEGVAVVLDDKDNPQVIFESLNSTGLDLSDIDLIRNYLLMNVDAENQTYLYEQYWIKMEELLEENFTQFVRDYLSMKNSFVTPSSKNKIYKAFQKYYEDNIKSIEEYLNDMLEIAKIYDRLLKPSTNNSKLGNALDDFIKLGMKTTYPFLLPLLIDNSEDYGDISKISDDEMTKIVKLMESYIIRRNVCNLAGGGLSQLMAQLYNSLIEKYGNEFYNGTYEKVSMNLASVTTKAYFPKDEEFIRELTERDMYKNRNIRFILEKIEKSNQCKELIDFSNLSIEHIMPQKLTEEWRDELLLTVDNPEDFHEEFKNNIGNLTLTAYNSEMSNKSFRLKKEHNDFSRLTLNNDLKMFSNWGKDEIFQRAIKIKDKALDIWRYPKIQNMDSISNFKIPLLDDEEFEYSGTTPSGISINNRKFLVNNWSNLYFDTLVQFYKLDKDLFLSILDKENFANSDKPVLTKNATELRSPRKVAKKENIFCETNFNTERKIFILKEISKIFRFEDDDIIIYID